MKRLVLVLVVVVCGAFSPALSGGLIEAPYPKEKVLNRAAFSPALSGGLIEAGSVWASPSPGPGVFPRVKRGPH